MHRVVYVRNEYVIYEKYEHNTKCAFVDCDVRMLCFPIGQQIDQQPMIRSAAKVGNIDYLQETCNKTALDLGGGGGGDSDKKNSSHFTIVLLKVRNPPFFVLGSSILEPRTCRRRKNFLLTHEQREWKKS
jgi:hypothetical protein